MIFSIILHLEFMPFSNSRFVKVAATKSDFLKSSERDPPKFHHQDNPNIRYAWNPNIANSKVGVIGNR